MIFDVNGYRGMTMTLIQSFLFGMMVVWTPSLLLLAWYLLKTRDM
jgi:hypothetical protein